MISIGTIKGTKEIRKIIANSFANVFPRSQKPRGFVIVERNVLKAPGCFKSLKEYKFLFTKEAAMHLYKVLAKK